MNVHLYTMCGDRYAVSAATQSRYRSRCADCPAQSVRIGPIGGRLGATGARRIGRGRRPANSHAVLCRRNPKPDHRKRQPGHSVSLQHQSLPRLRAWLCVLLCPAGARILGPERGNRFRNQGVLQARRGQAIAGRVVQTVVARRTDRHLGRDRLLPAGGAAIADHAQAASKCWSKRGRRLALSRRTRWCCAISICLRRMRTVGCAW